MSSFRLALVLLAVPLLAQAAVPRPVVSRSVRRNAIAIVVGIEHYTGGVKSASGAAADAQAFALFAEKTLGVPKPRVKLLVDDGATADDLKDALSWAKVTARPDGAVYFFFAGNGAASGSGEALLVLEGAKAPDLGAKSVTLASVLSQLSALPATEKVAFIDAGFSGAGARSLGKASVPSQSGVALLTAATADGAVFADGLGLFTNALLNGLRGAADKDADSKITLAELGLYVRTRVPSDSKSKGGAQLPNAQLGDLGFTVLVDSPGADAPLFNADRLPTVIGGAGKTSEDENVGGGGLGMAGTGGEEEINDDAAIAQAEANTRKTWDQPDHTRSTDDDEWSGAIHRGALPSIKDGRAGEDSRVKGYRSKCMRDDGDSCVYVGLAYDSTAKGDYGAVAKHDNALAAAFYLRSCELGTMDGCRNAALLYHYGSGIPKDHKRAFELYKKACDSGLNKGCNDLGWMYQYGLGGKTDPKKAIAMYRRACDEDYADGCINLGWMSENGKAGAPDYAAGAKWYGRACELGSMHGCGNLGIMYANGNGVPKDERKAMQLYKKACDGGYPQGCNDAGWLIQYGKGDVGDDARAVSYYRQACDGDYPDGCINLGWCYENGRGIKKDERRAFQYYQKSCDLKSPLGCKNLGILFANGKGARKDLKKAEELYSWSCERSNAEACNNLGWLYQNDMPNVVPAKKIISLYEQGCEGFDDKKSIDACVNLGWTYQNGKGVKVDEVKAARYYQLACDAESGLGCSNYGWMLEYGKGVKKNDSQAFSLYKKSCDLDNPDGCNNLGRAYQEGRGTRRDYSKAAQAYQQACDQDDEYACSNLGVLYEGGWGVSLDKTKAHELFRRACELGKTDACSK